MQIVKSLCHTPNTKLGGEFIKAASGTKRITINSENASFINQIIGNNQNITQTEPNIFSLNGEPTQLLCGGDFKGQGCAVFAVTCLSASSTVPLQGKPPGACTRTCYP